MDKKCSLCGSSTKKTYGIDRLCKRCWHGFQDSLRERKAEYGFHGVVGMKSSIFNVGDYF
jgi:hypothetical protein